MLDLKGFTLDYGIEYFAKMIPAAFSFSIASPVMMMMMIFCSSNKIILGGITCTFGKFHCLLLG